MSAFVQARTNNYFETLPQFFQAKRDRTAVMLREAGLTPVIPDGYVFRAVCSVPCVQCMEVI